MLVYYIEGGKGAVLFCKLNLSENFYCFLSKNARPVRIGLYWVMHPMHSSTHCIQPSSPPLSLSAFGTPFLTATPPSVQEV